MLDNDFLIKLEWETIPNALQEIANPETQYFWCDGVMADVEAPDASYTKKFINDKRYLPLQAYVGNDGGTKYKLILHFGPKALSRFARDLSIAECIPDTHASEWFTIDVQNQTIEIQLL
ncbi:MULTISPECIES: hypothetical protein [Niastella]|uniref:Uncharacterized protein n=1 Tax=Niastella soli TaxID=2821487 RepID=A0ABS3Z3E2_9BACT|nr:hypothetical protein [Niastella soli]MBO9204553.1 hypothetical protein [Niastella soli]